MSIPDFVSSSQGRELERLRILKFIERETAIYDFWDLRQRIYTEVMYFMYSKNGISQICDRPVSSGSSNVALQFLKILASVAQFLIDQFLIE